MASLSPAEIAAWGRRPRPAPHSSRAVPLDPRALAAHGLTTRDLSHAPPGTVVVACDGTALIVTAGGAFDAWSPFGRRAIASDPAAGSPPSTAGAPTALPSALGWR